MKHSPVDSTSISSIGYDEEKQELHINFHNTGTYVYHDVPPETHEALMMSGSKGNFLHHNIKGKHEHKKI